LAKWYAGEGMDPETNVPHLASVLACVGILVDAIVQGKLVDDRPPHQPQFRQLINSDAVIVVSRVHEIHKGRNPHHHTAKDKP
jgi:hypothetical protein